MQALTLDFIFKFNKKIFNFLVIERAIDEKPTSASFATISVLYFLFACFIEYLWLFHNTWATANVVLMKNLIILIILISVIGGTFAVGIEKKIVINRLYIYTNLILFYIYLQTTFIGVDMFITTSPLVVYLIAFFSSIFSYSFIRDIVRKMSQHG